MTFDPTSVGVTCVNLPKDHCVQVPWEYINVCRYSDQFCKNYHIHTHTTYIHIHIHTHTTYRISDHIVSFWTMFRRDKKCTTSGWALGDENVIGIRSFNIVMAKLCLYRSPQILIRVARMPCYRVLNDNKLAPQAGLLECFAFIPQDAYTLATILVSQLGIVLANIGGNGNCFKYQAITLCTVITW